MSGKYAFTKALKEVRFLFCHTGEGSAATRTFLNRAYPTMKKNNPFTPILIREASGTLPKVYARYEFGKEKSQSLEGTTWTHVDVREVRADNDATGLTDKQIEDTVAQLVKSETT
ncbi:NADH dehydrogenase, alpha subcomplex, subunit 2 [Daldinia decipiens]|uniref:NADH dehydrogenase, alpha subcomplex, subunit 2 n=1 Tax=Daldinia decipiens TaxID=326647 RepID=UPI0020C58BBC|nr:NADH dehydrogenase, alpha subcomplex, subunit 2 [Daldinia decipiens]KAI1655859.1 NADH dehydrogenase, alpha subcomplex, subunit 2 [Daldinia decipiens]